MAIGASAQQGAKISRIGIVDDAPMWQTFRQALRAVRTVQPALEKFYASLGDEQKERFNRLSPTQG